MLNKLENKLTEQQREQLHEDCEFLKSKNNTLEGEKQHKTNELRKYAELYVYYRQYFSRKLARKYSTLTYRNLVRKDL